ncbi:magnesium and cobalt transport protein CorA [Paramicrobacterium sp. CJ85]|uniref:magnesium and cobalt transport protein CorA n=1 Tax=Paramicrobacterium sp. CJ85 TaxID=3445355 RepID=UPI003F63092B
MSVRRAGDRSRRRWVPLLGSRSPNAVAARASGAVRTSVLDDGRPIEALDHANLDELSDALQQGENRVAIVAYDRPSDEEIHELADRLTLHPVLVEDLLHKGQRTKIERYDDTLFLVLRAARYEDSIEDVIVSEFHVVVQNQWVVIARQAASEAPEWHPDDLTQDADVLRHGTEAVLYTVIDTIVDTYFPVIEGVENDLAEIEGQVFEGDVAAPERIYRLGREVNDLQRAIAPLAKVIGDLVAGFHKYGTAEGLQAYLRDVSDHATRATARVGSVREMLAQILTVNATLVGQRQNEDMKRISSWAAILFAPTLVGAIYGMNFTNMPELHWGFGYPMALGLMLLIGVVLYFVFKKQRWM